MKTLVCILFILANTAGILFQSPAKADPPSSPHPPPGGHGHAGNAAPPGAPIDGGLGVLLLLGTAYGGLRVITRNRDERSR